MEKMNIVIWGENSQKNRQMKAGQYKIQFKVRYYNLPGDDKSLVVMLSFLYNLALPTFWYWLQKTYYSRPILSLSC